MSVGNSWVQIQGTPKKPTTPLCWEAKNGKTSVGTKLILATCAINPPDKQQFMLEDMSDDDLEKKVIPKVNLNMVIGVKHLCKKAWLRLETDDEDITQKFVRVEYGRVQVGKAECDTDTTCFFVTNQSLNADPGDPVMLRTKPYLEKFLQHGDVIEEWDF